MKFWFEVPEFLELSVNCGGRETTDGHDSYPARDRASVLEPDVLHRVNRVLQKLRERPFSVVSESHKYVCCMRVTTQYGSLKDEVGFLMT